MKKEDLAQRRRGTEEEFTTNRHEPTRTQEFHTENTEGRHGGHGEEKLVKTKDY